MIVLSISGWGNLSGRNQHFIKNVLSRIELIE